MCVYVGREGLLKKDKDWLEYDSLPVRCKHASYLLCFFLFFLSLFPESDPCDDENAVYLPWNGRCLYVLVENAKNLAWIRIAHHKRGGGGR